MEKQTAVEWFIRILNSPVCNGFIQGRRQIPHDIIQQAIEMEKQQIIDAHLDGQSFSIAIEEIDYGEQYYNETFKNK